VSDGFWVTARVRNCRPDSDSHADHALQAETTQLMVHDEASCVGGHCLPDLDGWVSTPRERHCSSVSPSHADHALQVETTQSVLQGEDSCSDGHGLPVLDGWVSTPRERHCSSVSPSHADHALQAETTQSVLQGEDSCSDGHGLPVLDGWVLMPRDRCCASVAASHADHALQAETTQSETTTCAVQEELSIRDELQPQPYPPELTTPLVRMRSESEASHSDQALHSESAHGEPRWMSSKQPNKKTTAKATLLAIASVFFHLKSSL
jgi:hypothetical protein